MFLDPEILIASPGGPRGPELLQGGKMVVAAAASGGGGGGGDYYRDLAAAEGAGPCWVTHAP